MDSIMTDGLAPVATQAPEVVTSAPVAPAPVSTPQELPEFIRGLPEHLRMNQQLTKFDSTEKLAEAYVNASKLIGKRAQDLQRSELIGILGDEGVAQVYSKMGVPESADKYEVQGLDHLDSTMKSKVLQKAHELGLSQDAMRNLVEMELGVSNELRASQQQKWQAEIFNHYGRDAERALNYAKNAVSQFGGEPLKAYLNQSGLGDHPALVSAFVNIGKAMSEDTVPFAGHTPKGTEATSIESEITKLRNDKDFNKRWRSGDKGAAKTMENLYRRLHDLSK